MRSYFVYALDDPRDGTCHYIGITDNPKARFSAHLHPDNNLEKSAWIQELIMWGLLPVMRILAEVKTRDEARELEIRFIHEYLGQGALLLNRDIRRPLSHWTQVTEDYPILFYKVFRVPGGFWVVGVVDEEKRLYRLRDEHKTYTTDYHAYPLKDRLNKQLVS